MSSTYKKIDYFNSEEGTRIRERLHQMELDDKYHTKVSSYTTDGAHFPDNQMPFVVKHLTYLNTHPNVDPEQYLSNLRLKLRIRS
jgi:hypothetical protein